MRRSAARVLVALVVSACSLSSGASPQPTKTTPVFTSTPAATLSPSGAPSPEPAATPSQSPSMAPTVLPVRTAAVDPHPTGAPSAHRAAASAVDALGADLYRQLIRDHQNLVFSPYSAEVALAMARVGAKGLTASQMDTVLHAALVADLDMQLGALERELARRPGQYPYGGATVPLELATANRLWAQSGYDFNQPFLDVLSTRYGAGIGVVDYIGARDAARKAINEWVADRTRSRIPELIPEKVLDELTRFVITNAIYLKAKWIRPFSVQSTRPAPFHRLDGTDSQVQMMRGGIVHFPYRRGPDHQVVHLPYVGGLSMVLIVPDAGAFAAFESRLDGASLTRIAEDVAHTSVDLSLPRFDFRTASVLKEPLRRLGMPIAFSDAADFSGITTREPLLIQTVIQQAVISVDEEGTEAAASTAVIGGATGGPNEWVTLTIDRPFIFTIRDDATGATLFMGRVLDPAQS